MFYFYPLRPICRTLTQAVISNQFWNNFDVNLYKTLSKNTKLPEMNVLKV